MRIPTILGEYMLFDLMNGDAAPLPFEIGMFRAGAIIGMQKKVIAFTTICLGKRVDVHLVCTAPEPVGKIVLVTVFVTLEGLQTEATWAIKTAIVSRLKQLFFGAYIVDNEDDQPKIKIPFEG